MARLIGILAGLATVASMAALLSCSSGVSNSGAGAIGTDCKGGDLNLICTGFISFQNGSTSIDVFATDTNGNGQPNELIKTSVCTLHVTITDPLGTFSHIFQGVTFETFDISYASGVGHAPVLGTRRATATFSITLTNNTGSGTVDLPCVDLRTKKLFADQDSNGKVFPYVMTIRATGRDFATNSVVVVTARINIEIGDFVTTVPTTPSTASAIDYRAGLMKLASLAPSDLHLKWQ